MIDFLKALVRDTALEQPARRLYNGFRMRTQDKPFISPETQSDADARGDPTPTACAASHNADPNADYDAQTASVMAQVLKADAVCVDVGCHMGQILDEMRRLAPQGHHYGFEPLPDLARALGDRYADAQNVTIHNAALNDEPGTFRFQHVKSNPGYSGFRRRRYDRPDEEVVETDVTAVRLDDVLPPNTTIDFIKIDVEGAELQVLKGAQATLARSQPVVVFEHGLGAADFYDTRPEQVYDFFDRLGLDVFLMSAWLTGGSALHRTEFISQFESGENFYFMAAPSTRPRTAGD